MSLTYAQKVAMYEDWKAEQGKKFAYLLDKGEEGQIRYRHHLTLGASTTSIVLGASKYQTRQELMDYMLGRVPEDFSVKFCLEMGKDLEPVVTKRFSERTKLLVAEGVTGSDWRYPWISYQIDRTIPALKSDLELKIAFHNGTFNGDLKDWGKDSVFNNNGVLVFASDEIPLDYYYQVQKQMLYREKDSCYLCAWLTYEQRVRIYHIKADKDVQQKIFEADDDFTFNHLIPDVPFDDSDDKRLQRLEESADDQDLCFADSECEELIARHIELSSRQYKLKKDIDEIKKRIKEKMGSHKGIVNKNNLLAVNLSTVTRREFDADKFANEHPDMYGDYIKETSYTKMNFIKSKKAKSKKGA